VLRVVLDTNVFVSGLLSKTGLPAKILDAWRAGQYLLIASPPIVAEIKRVLQAPRIREKYFITDGDIEQLIILLEKEALIVPGYTDVKDAIPDDPSDEMFLACAVDAAADFIPEAASCSTLSLFILSPLPQFKFIHRNCSPIKDNQVPTTFKPIVSGPALPLPLVELGGPRDLNGPRM